METQGSLSPERMKRMHGIANDYMQAEFAIGSAPHAATGW